MPNFQSSNDGTWFYFDPDNEDAGGVCLRELSTDEFTRIEKITTKHHKKVMRGILVDDAEVDEKAAARMRWDFCIIGWKEVCLDGHPLECTSENKVKMMKVTDFVKFIVDSLNELTETNKALEEARVKNLPPSPNGNSESQPVTPA